MLLVQWNPRKRAKPAKAGGAKLAGTFVQTGSAGPLSAVAFGNPASTLDLSESTLAISGVDEDLNGDPTGAQPPGSGSTGTPRRCSARSRRAITPTSSVRGARLPS